MRLKLAGGLALLGWQIIAGAFALVGQLDAALDATDSSWLATLYAILLSPPPWLVWVALVMSFILILLSQREARQARGEKQPAESQTG